MKKLLLILMLSMITLTNTACWETPDNGKVKVQTVYGEAKQVVRPPGIYTIVTLCDEYTDVTLTSQTTDDIVVRGQSADNAAFKWNVRLTFSVPDDDGKILAHVKKFGFNEQERNIQVGKAVFLELQSQVSNYANGYNAYSLVDKSNEVQVKVFENMKAFFTNQMYLNLENLQLVGKPDFDNDDIDSAASKVVASSKLKEAAEATLAAEKVEAERKQLQAASFSNPALLQIKLLELKLQIEEARAKGIAAHQGTLVIGNADTAIQLPQK